MKSSISNFFLILADNDFKVGYRDIPDETQDNTDSHPDDRRYIELNGKSTPKELEEYLEKSFRKFIKELHAEKLNSNENFYSEFQAMLNGTLKIFRRAYFDAHRKNDRALIEFYEVKHDFLKRIAELFHPKEEIEEKHKKISSKDRVYYFSVNEQFHDKYEIHLNNLYDDLRELEYINCSISQFKNLFRPAGKTKLKNPDPVIWTSGYYSHLAYFVKCLVNTGFIPNSRRPSFNQIALKLFYDKEEGVFFKPESPKADIKDETISPYAEIRQLVEELR